MKEKYCVLLSTTNSVEEASKIAGHLVERHLVACVNIIPSILSVYRWENKVNSDPEILLIMKTLVSSIPRVEKAIRELHSYETPELIALPIQYGMKEYLKWMADSVK